MKGLVSSYFCIAKFKKAFQVSTYEMYQSWISKNTVCYKYRLINNCILIPIFKDLWKSNFCPSIRFAIKKNISRFLFFWKLVGNNRPFELWRQNTKAFDSCSKVLGKSETWRDRMEEVISRATTKQFSLRATRLHEAYNRKSYRILLHARQGNTHLNEMRQ